MGFSLENPGLYAGGNVVSALTNVPLDRLFTKINNLKDAADAENQTWQRIGLFMGYNRWDLGMEKPTSVLEAKEEIKAEKKQAAKIKREEQKAAKVLEEENKLKEQIEEEKKQEKEGKLKDPKCSAIRSNGQRCGNSVAKAGDLCTIHEKKEQNETGEETTCKGTRTNGQPCNMKTTNKSGYCFYHD